MEDDDVMYPTTISEDLITQGLTPHNKDVLARYATALFCSSIAPINFDWGVKDACGGGGSGIGVTGAPLQ